MDGELQKGDSVRTKIFAEVQYQAGGFGAFDCGVDFGGGHAEVVGEAGVGGAYVVREDGEFEGN
jgi:hypothetical protein